MAIRENHAIEVTKNNPALGGLALSWQTAEYSAEDGLGPMGSLHEAGDSLVAVARLEEGGDVTILGSGVMVGPGLLLTATHVLDEFPICGPGPIFLTFLPDGCRAWLPRDQMTVTKPSQFDERRKVKSDITLVSCTLNSEAHAGAPLMLAPMEVALPLVGDRLWAMGFRHQGMDGRSALITPFVSSGLVTAAFPHGRGERMASPCFEVDMDTLGGMSGGPVFNADGRLVGIVSSSLEGGPSHITLIWEAIRFRVAGATPKLRANKTVSLLGAQALGLAKLKGHIERDPFGDVTLKLSEDEGALFAASIAPMACEAAKPRVLDESQLEAFLDSWGTDLEDAALEGAIQALGRVSVEKARELLADDNMPREYLDAIEGFWVEDFDGVEDLTVTGSEAIDEDSFCLDYYFDVGALIWTVEMDEAFARDNAEGLAEHFYNSRSEHGIAVMEAYQRRYFRGSAIFHRDAEAFTDAAITLSALKPRRRAKMRNPGA
ncbi:MAG: serine protease [Sphingomonas sp.]